MLHLKKKKESYSCFDLFSICIMEYILIYLKKKKAAAAAAYIHIYNYSDNNIAAAA